jgi:hypothetical protein
VSGTVLGQDQLGKPYPLNPREVLIEPKTPNKFHPFVALDRFRSVKKSCATVKNLVTSVKSGGNIETYLRAAEFKVSLRGSPNSPHKRDSDEYCNENPRQQKRMCPKFPSGIGDGKKVACAARKNVEQSGEVTRGYQEGNSHSKRLSSSSASRCEIPDQQDARLLYRAITLLASIGLKSPRGEIEQALAALSTFYQPV